MTTGVELILAERQRQIEQEGYTAESDAAYDNPALALAAACYAVPATHRTMRPSEAWIYDVPVRWPWARQFWKPTPDDRVRELVKAGALIAAEIDRLIVAGRA